MTIYNANENGQPIDDNGNVVSVDYSLYNGTNVYAFNTYEEYVDFMSNLN